MQDATIVRMGVRAWWVHALILLFFLVFLPYSKHMHLMWAPVAVFFAEMPLKGDAPAGRGKKRDKSRPPRWVSSPGGCCLNGYACAECGRCEHVCPAAASGAEISPRQVVHDLKEFVLSRAWPRSAERSPANGNGPEFVGGTVPAGGHLGLHHLPRLRGQLPGPQRARPA